MVGITGWICCQYLQRTQTLAVYFLGSQDESISINFFWNIELPVFSASKNLVGILEDKYHFKEGQGSYMILSF